MIKLKAFMNKFIAIFSILLLTLFFSIQGQAQDTTTVSLDDYVEELNAECPVNYDGDWGVNSYTMVGDRYALVDLKLPANLSMFLSSFGANTSNVKQLWIKQLKQYGDRWNRFVDMMVQADRRIILNLHPEGSKKTALITLKPKDFNK